MNAAIITLIQGILILALAPFSMGLVRMVKARMQGRHGASPFLPYFTIATLLKKEMVISTSTSWVFRLVPFVVLGTTLFLVLVLPLIGIDGALAPLSDFIVVAAVLAIGAVFLVLGGFDSASAFGGMGSAREMTIASLIEPTIIVTFAAFALANGSTSINDMVTSFQPVLALSIMSLILVALAENARYPVDNPATHLELTMVHEAMVLEYSGPYLAMLEYASALKLTIFTVLIANLLFPNWIFVTYSLPSAIFGAIVMLVVKLTVGMFLLGLLESSIAKMRFFRMQEYLSIAFFVALGGLVVVLTTLV